MGKQKGKSNRGPDDNRNKPNKSKPCDKSNGTRPDEESNDNRMSRKQDPFWYAKDEKAIKNMANLPFLEVLGEVIGQSRDYVPGIVTFRYFPTIGSEGYIEGEGSGADNASLNGYATRAAQAYYNYVVEGFTGGVDFEAPDLMMTAIAGDSLMAAMMEGKRAYGLAKYYLQFNNTYAATALKALGFEPKALISNLADFRAEYNIRVNQINKLIAVPKQFYIGDRWEFQNAFIFTDTDDPDFSTGYAWVSQAALKYTPTLIDTGTCLTWLQKSTNSQGIDFMTQESYFAYIDELINALVDDDVRSMFGAIRRVYSDGDLKQLSELEEGYSTPVIRNDVVAMQVHNMSWVSGGVFGIYGKLVNGAFSQAPLTNVPLYQDANGALISVIACTKEAWQPLAGYTERLLDLYDHLATPDVVLDATTTMTFATGRIQSGSTATGNDYYRMACRTEVVFRVQAWAGAQVWDIPYSMKQSDVGASIYTVSAMSHLDSHPIMLVTDGGGNVLTYLGEIDKYTIVANSVLEKMHNRSLYQLLAMPANSKSVTK